MYYCCYDVFWLFSVLSMEWEGLWGWRNDHILQPYIWTDHMENHRRERWYWVLSIPWKPEKPCGVGTERKESAPVREGDIDLRIYLYTFILTFVFSFFLFFPWNKKIYEEERMVTYSSLSYKIIIWKGRDERNRFEFYPFPKNLKNSLELLADP